MVLVAADNVAQRSSAQEIFLLKTKFLAFKEVVVRIQHARNVFGNVAVQNGTNVITTIERRKLEVDRGFGRPQTKSVDNIVLVARYRIIVRDSDNSVGIYPTVATIGFFNATKEMNILLRFRTLTFPRVAKLEPIIRLLNLPAIVECLNYIFKNIVKNKGYKVFISFTLMIQYHITPCSNIYSLKVSFLTYRNTTTHTWLKIPYS